MTVRALIVDDEAVARRRIRRLLAPERDIVLVGECGDGASALKAIVADKPHLVFLDVQMPELDGFEVVLALAPEELPDVVFVTAFDRYALRAFDVHAVDYLLKPFTRERFQTALSRARARLETPRSSPTDHLAPLMDDVRATRPHPTRVAVRTGDRFVVVEWDQVDWIEAADNYVTLHVGPRALRVAHRHVGLLARQHARAAVLRLLRHRRGGPRRRLLPAEPRAGPTRPPLGGGPPVALDAAAAAPIFAHTP